MVRKRVLANARGAQLRLRELLVKIPPRRIIFASLFLLLIPSLGVCALEFCGRSVSPSGQFVIYGADPAFRGAVSALAEKIKANFLSVLKRRDVWKTAIVVNLRPHAVNLPEVPPAELRFSRTETGLKFQLDLTVSQKMSPAAIERELARVILVEMIYRDKTSVASADFYVDPPVWLVDGLLAAAPNQDRGSLAAALSVSARVPGLAEFLKQPPEIVDPSARQLYRAFSWVLVQLLIDRPSGRSRLGRYVDNLAFASNDPIADLGAAFPEVSNFENGWKSKIAEMRTISDQDLLTFSQSDEKLNELLGARFPSRDGSDKSVLFEDFSRIRPASDQHRALQELSKRLLLLATRANPVLRPIIENYQRIADQFALRRNRGTEKRLAELKSLRTKLSARMNDVDDYMNWFEATKLETRSGMFDDYLQAAGATESQQPKRRDPLSVYLDAMELEF